MNGSSEKLPAGFSPEFTIRKADASDIPFMAQLAKEEPNAAQWALQQYRNIFAVTSPQRIALVMQDNSTFLMGFIVGRCLGEEWEVENIVIAAAQRKHGLGTRLLQEFMRQAKSEGAHSIGLEVRESNHAAQAFYRKLGFSEISRRGKYYSAPEEDALIYQLTFAESNSRY